MVGSPCSTRGAQQLQLLDFGRFESTIIDDGLQTNASVGPRYLDAWLHGTGAAAIDNLMENAATAEISRAQIWSWVKVGRFYAGAAPRRAGTGRGQRRPRGLIAEVALGNPFNRVPDAWATDSSHSAATRRLVHSNTSTMPSTWHPRGWRRMTDTDKAPLHDTTQAKLDWLADLRDEALHPNTEGRRATSALAGQAALRGNAPNGCATTGSFFELDRYVRHRETITSGWMSAGPTAMPSSPATGLILGRQGVRLSRRTSPSSAARCRRCSRRRSPR